MLSKKSIAVLLLALLVALMAGCGANQGGGNSSSSESGTHIPRDPTASSRSLDQPSANAVENIEEVVKEAATNQPDLPPNVNRTDVKRLPNQVGIETTTLKNFNEGEEGENAGTLTADEAEAKNKDAQGAIQNAKKPPKKSKKGVRKKPGHKKPKPKPTAGPPTTYWIALVNNGTSLTDQEVATVAEALEAQVNEDFGPQWNLNVDLGWYRSVSEWQTNGPGTWPIYLSTYCPPPHCGGPGGGYHGNAGNLPYAEIYYAGNHNNVSFPSSHELMEMLINPLPWSYPQFAQYGNYQYMMETADPVWHPNLGYYKNGVLVSDWIRPNYFMTYSTGPWDYKGYLTKSWLNPSCTGSGFQIYSWKRAPSWYQYACF